MRFLIALALALCATIAAAHGLPQGHALAGHEPLGSLELHIDARAPIERQLDANGPMLVIADSRGDRLPRSPPDPADAIPMAENEPCIG